MKTAKPVTRLIAAIIDNLIYGLVFLLVILGIAAAGSLQGALDGVLNLILVLVWFSIFWQITVAWMTANWGGSLGKLVCGIEITGEDGKRLTFWRAVFRTMVKSVSGALMGAGYWWILVDKERRAWHDQVAGTKVIEKNASAIWMGIVAAAALVLVTAWVVGEGIGAVKQNLPVYEQIIEDLQREFEQKQVPPMDNYGLDKDLVV